ncbi:glutathione peroxidase [Paenibacillus chitinolyticus]|uniref:Glutathione peroxidase n=1 Tax=Paenibacillus chitinolyticus TaxID=79263 RepID=A0A410WRP4_9BACL|nr:glutathione peroxidase [Paenibacillus chitinolyticus]MCY9593891.1 glutathione peroxidase [Paenibacillus chitinolyticus]MCY9598793.1 glutathione peroxidase [Paenibacillus chitinolyticus]QAV17002.1 glutathione peroxidase [Paenibacillus chitinolyticus]GKS14034.1 glutathione peroxidase [Paenibacillus chitinolyticus]
MGVYEFTAQRINGEEQSLEDYKGKVLLIVNTASKCGFTPQYQGLQELYDAYKDQGLVVLGFPSNQFMEQEPGTNEEIEQFCQVNYGVTFPMYSKIDVKGSDAHPLFQYLTRHTAGILSKEVKWNFSKFLVNRSGDVVSRYAPTTAPSKISGDIEKLLAE